MCGAIAFAPTVQLNGVGRDKFSLFTEPHSVGVLFSFRLHFANFFNSGADNGRSARND